MLALLLVALAVAALGVLPGYFIRRWWFLYFIAIGAGSSTVAALAAGSSVGRESSYSAPAAAAALLALYRLPFAAGGAVGVSLGRRRRSAHRNEIARRL
jgi:hypothetical protein